jgi:hypothetical protein
MFFPDTLCDPSHSPMQITSASQIGWNSGPTGPVGTDARHLAPLRLRKRDFNVGQSIGQHGRKIPAPAGMFTPPPVLFSNKDNWLREYERSDQAVVYPPRSGRDDAQHLGWLDLGRGSVLPNRCTRRASDELPAVHSMTLSARATRVTGTVRSIARAVLIFMTRLNLVGI